jgi:glycerophosphoryl diester phosphodiesterase
VIHRASVALALLVAADVTLGGLGAISGPPVPLIAAHRGGAALWPENSPAAFRGAIALGVDALEFDVHQTADFIPVVVHDATLDRTTTLQGPVRDMTRAALGAARLRDAAGVPTEERVPTLAEVLDLAAAARVQVLPEIKLDDCRRPYPGLEERVLDLLRTRGLLGRATVQSFDVPTLRRLRALEASVRTMLLVDHSALAASGAPAEDTVAWAKAVGATDLGIDHRLADGAVVSAARAAGARLSAWTVNDEADLLRVRALGVDLVMTDRPDLARRVYGRR